MKIELVTYMASENGITIRLLPDNDVEYELLKGFGRHAEKCVFEDGELRIAWRFKQAERGKE